MGTCATIQNGEQWHAVHCKNHQEFTAEENLQRQRFKIYLPRLQTRKRFSGKWMDAVEPLFPGYLFLLVNAAVQSLRPIRSTRGVLALVRFGDHLAVVAASVVEELRGYEDKQLRMRRDDRRDFASGEPVQLIDGRFTGMDAVFLEPDGKRRANVLLQMLNGSTKVCVPLDWLRKAA